MDVDEPRHEDVSREVVPVGAGDAIDRSGRDVGDAASLVDH
jgi:hypothetical protein